MTLVWTVENQDAAGKWFRVTPRRPVGRAAPALGDVGNRRARRRTQDAVTERVNAATVDAGGFGISGTQ